MYKFRLRQANGPIGNAFVILEDLPQYCERCQEIS